MAKRIGRSPRKKTWKQKVAISSSCYLRAQTSVLFAPAFYENLFFLNPEVKNYFKNTDWEHQEKALIQGLQHLFKFLDEPKSSARNHLIRIAITHGKQGIKVHPHDYYYWVDALILTLQEFDPLWDAGNEFYVRECLFYPISFLISHYHFSEK